MDYLYKARTKVVNGRINGTFPYQVDDSYKSIPPTFYFFCPNCNELEKVYGGDNNIVELTCLSCNKKWIRKI